MGFGLEGETVALRAALLAIGHSTLVGEDPPDRAGDLQVLGVVEFRFDVGPADLRSPGRTGEGERQVTGREGWALGRGSRGVHP